MNSEPKEFFKVGSPPAPAIISGVVAYKAVNGYWEPVTPSSIRENGERISEQEFDLLVYMYRV